MTMEKLYSKLVLTALLLFAVGAAIAQVAIPYVPSINQNDVLQIVPRGFPSAQTVYATAGQVAGVEQYSYQVPLTGFAITPPNLTALLYLNPAGTLATGTLTMPAVASDGQRLCVEDSQTQTAITIAANTGQTLASFGLGAVTALTANTKYCWLYQGSAASWIRTQ